MDFLKRFNIKIDIKESESKFINRITVFLDKMYLGIYEDYGYELYNFISIALGVPEVDTYRSFDSFYEKNITDFLKTIEAVYTYLRRRAGLQARADMFDAFVSNILKYDDFQLNFEWKEGKFYPSKVGLLDEELVNVPLQWLSSNEYSNVYLPFSKGLDLFIKSKNDSRLLNDVITDMYEALEAFSKIVTGRDKDLSANRKIFIKTLKVSEKYKSILKEYIEYANEFRHGSISNKNPIKPFEAESFIYLTGIFFRIGIETLKKQ